MALRIGTGMIEVDQTWSDLKDIVALKDLRLQYHETPSEYVPFAVDQMIVYTSLIYKGTVPTGSAVDQTTNDANKSDFETNFKSGANRRITSAIEVVFDDLTVADGYTTTASTSFTPIEATTYTEQTANGQRSLVSSSADDAAAGTGARKVQITYYDQAMAGPFTEEVTLNGTTAVDTTATDICFIERMDVTEVGSQLGNVGTVSLKASTGGGGATVGSIAPGDNETNWVHHYVGASRITRVLSVYAHIKGAAGGAAHLRRATPTVANTPEKTVVPVLRVPPGVQSILELPVPLTVAGPARLTLYANPDMADSADWLAGFNFVDAGS